VTVTPAAVKWLAAAAGTQAHRPARTQARRRIAAARAGGWRPAARDLMIMIMITVTAVTLVVRRAEAWPSCSGQRTCRRTAAAPASAAAARRLSAASVTAARASGRAPPEPNDSDDLQPDPKEPRVQAK
jgi:hypothetical protein